MVELIRCIKATQGAKLKKKHEGQTSDNPIMDPSLSQGLCETANELPSGPFVKDL